MSWLQNIAVLFVISSIYRPCEATSSLRVVGSGFKSGITHRLPDDASSFEEEEDDAFSFIFTGSDLKSSPTGFASPETEIPSAPLPLLTIPDDILDSSSTADDSWETRFAKGISESKYIVEADESHISYCVDAKSDGAVPSRMLKAEQLLQAAIEEVPQDLWKGKAAEHALRIYYHAKWLAERNYGRAAEIRYREAAELARKCRRKVLASHALARLGYYLVQWNRKDEAADVLKASIQENLKSNPLAPFLHGVLERKAAGSDIERLQQAEEYILNADEQPSDELEQERQNLVDEISFWRQAETSSKHCFASADSAYMVICLAGHAMISLRRYFFN